MKKLPALLLIILAATGLPAAAQEAAPPPPVVMDEVVVTATTTEVPGKETGVSYSVITEKEIEERQATLVEEMLRSVPGVTVNQTGGAGGLTELYLRGGNANNTQVLFNGVRLNDAGGTFDFSTLTVDNVQRVEVIRGPMSALYGADAMTGVINLVTIKGFGPPRLTVTSETGAHSENGFLMSEQRASLLGSYKTFAYSVAYSRTDDNGILNLNNRFGSNVLNSRLDWDARDNLSFKFFTLLIDSRAGYPTVNGGDRFDSRSNGGPGLDPDRNNTKLDATLGLTGNYLPFTWWENELTLAYSHRDRHFNDQFNPQTAIDVTFGSFFSRNLERRLSLDYHSNFRVGCKETVESVTTIGTAARTEQLKQTTASGEAFFFGPDFPFPGSRSSLKTGRSSTALYTQEQLSLWQRLFLVGGLRLENNSVFAGPELAPRASAAFRITETDTTIRAAGGRGIKEPDFLQSFARDQLAVGNPKLKPEQNISWETGVDQYLYKDRVKLSATYFENHFTDLIAFVSQPPVSTFENVGKVRTTGLELALKARTPWGLTVGGAYTRLFQFTVLEAGAAESLFFHAGKHLLRRPRHTFSFDLDYAWRKLGVHLNGLYTGSRDDTRFTFTEPFTLFDFQNARVINGDYFILNLAATYDLFQNWHQIKKVQLLARINNLLDRHYEEAFGYSSPRLNAVAGLRLVY